MYVVYRAFAVHDGRSRSSITAFVCEVPVRRSERVLNDFSDDLTVSSKIALTRLLALVGKVRDEIVQFRETREAYIVTNVYFEKSVGREDRCVPRKYLLKLKPVLLETLCERLLSLPRFREMNYSGVAGESGYCTVDDYPNRGK